MEEIWGRYRGDIGAGLVARGAPGVRVGVRGRGTGTGTGRGRGRVRVNGLGGARRTGHGGGVERPISPLYLPTSPYSSLHLPTPRVTGQGGVVVVAARGGHGQVGHEHGEAVRGGEGAQQLLQTRQLRAWLGAG